MDLRNRSLTGWAGFRPNTLVLHDYGGSPTNSEGMFNPYNALVFPDGKVRYRDPSNPYGAPAPHAHKMNPTSVGLSYAGPVGSTPTPLAMDALRAERDKILAQYPGMATMSHGEAYEKTKGTDQQASKDGRGLDEASWRTRLNWSPYDIDNDPNPPEMGGSQPTAVASSQPASNPATRVAGYQAAVPNPAQAEQPGFLGLLSDGMMSPLFQMGAGVFGAASEGKNIGTGLLHGGQAAQRAQAMQLQGMEARRKLAAQEQMKRLWGNLGSLGLPPQQTAALTALGPEAGAPLLSQLIQAQAQNELQNADPLRRAQVDNIPLERRLKEAQIAQAERKDAMGDAQAKILRGTFPELFGDTPSGQQSSMVRPQSFDATQSGVPGVQLVNDPGQQPAGPMLPPQAPPRQFKGLDPRKAMGLSMVPGMGDAAKIAVDAYNQDRLGKEGQNKVDEKALNASEQQARLAAIRSLYRPEFQQFETRAGMTFKALADKIGTGRLKLNDADQKLLGDYTTFRAEAYDNLNQYIKEITGAAMTNAEAERIMRSIPNPGENWFDGDSPTQFKAKLDGAIRKTQMAIARMEFAKREGKPWQSVPLSQMPAIIDQRGNQLQQQLKGQGISDEQAQGMIRKQLRAEFGIDS